MGIDIEYLFKRYDRQTKVIGVEGQKKLSNACVAVIGAGGLGSPAILYLAAAGVGKIIVVDKDVVSITDLNRQILYSEDDIGRKKAVVVCEKLKKFNSRINVECLDVEFNDENSREIVKKANIIVDALDNWETRFILNRLCVEYKKPFVHAGINGWYGQITTIIPGKTPCLSCIIPRPSPRRTVPVIGVTPGILGVLEASEAIKYILGLGDLLIGKLLVIDLQYNEFRTIEIKKNPQCPVCRVLQEL
jgi:adenylyltransferase/sulfurtransferase